MKRLRLFGNIIFSVAVLFVFTVIVYHNHLSVYKTIILVLFFLSAILGMIASFKKGDLGNTDKISIILLKIVSILVGAFLTFILVKYVNINCVIASSLIGLIGALLLPMFADAIFCGSFVGMTGIASLTIINLLFASIIVAAIYIITKDTYEGRGGKLGSIAFIGVLLATFSTDFSFVSEEAMMPNKLYLYICLGIAAATITFLINHNIGLGPTLSSSIVGLVGGLIFLYALPAAYAVFAPVIYGASFIGMSSKKVFPSIWFVLAAGLVFGVVYILNIENFNGIGGKLGMTAFISVLIIIGLQSLHKTNNRKLLSNEI